MPLDLESAHSGKFQIDDRTALDIPIMLFEEGFRVRTADNLMPGNRQDPS